MRRGEVCGMRGMGVIPGGVGYARATFKTRDDITLQQSTKC